MPKRQYIDNKFGQLHLRVSQPQNPSARAVLCIHISPLSGVVYDEVLKELGSDRLVIAPDTPGYGMSDAPLKAPSIQDYADSMIELIEELQLKELDLIGYGTGSKIAFETALKKPEKVKHLILISAPDYTPQEIVLMNNSLGRTIEPKDDGSHLLHLWKQVSGFKSLNTRMRMFCEHIRAGKRKPWGPRAAFAFQYRDKIDSLLTPLLILNISNEITAPTKRLKTKIKVGKYLERLDWQHGFLETYAAEFSGIVRNFTST